MPKFKLRRQRFCIWSSGRWALCDKNAVCKNPKRTIWTLTIDRKH